MNSARSMALNECLEALGRVMEFNTQDSILHQHAVRVGEMALMVGHRLGYKPEILRKLYYGGLLHDLGKISVDPAILVKKGPLGPSEFAQVKQHPAAGARIVASLPGLDDLALWVRWHHEWWDGSGYPDGLVGDEIPQEVQLLSAVDCLDSLATPRADRQRFSDEEVTRVMLTERGSHFSSELVDYLLDLKDQGFIRPGLPSNKSALIRHHFLSEQVGGDWERADSEMAGIFPVLRLFARVIDSKHRYTRGHSMRVAVLARYLAQQLGLAPDQVLKAEISGLLHDAGKVSVPVGVLDKPGRPSDSEWKLIQCHPAYSYRILNTVSCLKDIAVISAGHHERYDGKGYPRRLRGGSIDLISQIIAVADTYDAMTSTRSYRKGLPPETAYKAIRENLGSQFNPRAGKVLLDTPPRHLRALFETHCGG